jgi:hypothetical protein
MPFELAIYTQKSANVVELKGDMPSKSVDGKWDGKTAGGCPNMATWHNNPQFNLSSEHSVKVTVSSQFRVKTIFDFWHISLEQKTSTKKDVEPLGLFIFPAAHRGERVVVYGKNPPVSVNLFSVAAYKL